MLRNDFNDFAFEHRSGCCATEPGYAGDIGTIEIWLIDWLNSLVYYVLSLCSGTTARGVHMLISFCRHWARYSVVKWVAYYWSRLLMQSYAYTTRRSIQDSPVPRRRVFWRNRKQLRAVRPVHDTVGTPYDVDISVPVREPDHCPPLGPASGQDREMENLGSLPSTAAQNALVPHASSSSAPRPGSSRMGQHPAYLKDYAC